MTDKAGDGRLAGFLARGGAWVLAQGVVFLAAFVVPIQTGSGSLVPVTATDWLAAVLTVAGLTIAIAGLIGLGKSLTPFPRPLPEAELRVDGPYGLVRHPVYFGVLVASCGWSWWWQSGWGALFCLGAAVFLDRKAAREEAWLREKFPGYAAYAARVRRLLPWIY